MQKSILGINRRHGELSYVHLNAADRREQTSHGWCGEKIDRQVSQSVGGAPASVVVDSGANTDVQRRREDDRALFELAQTRP